MSSLSVKVDRGTAIAAAALMALLESPGGADVRAGAAVSVDTLERINAATEKLRWHAMAQLAQSRARSTPESEYTFEILNADSTVAAHAVVKWPAGDPAGARTAAIAQQSAGGRFDPAAQRIGAAPVKEVSQ